MGKKGIISGKPITLSQRIELAHKSGRKPFTPQEIFESYFENQRPKIHPDAIVFVAKEKIKISTWIFFEAEKNPFFPKALYDEKTEKVMVVKGEISDELFVVSECQKVDHCFLIKTLPVSVFEEIEEEKTFSEKAKT